MRAGTASHIRMSPKFSTIWLGYSVFLTILIGESRRTSVLSGGLSAEKGLLSLLRVCKHFMTLELKRGLNLLTACLIGKKLHLYCSYDQQEAEMLYIRAMHIREQSLGPDHLLLATTLFHLGMK